MKKTLNHILYIIVNGLNFEAKIRRVNYFFLHEFIKIFCFVLTLFQISIVDNDISFDINAEWNKFWRRKVQELYDRDLSEKMDELLKDLGLNRDSPTRSKYFERKYDREM